MPGMDIINKIFAVLNISVWISIIVYNKSIARMEIVKSIAKKLAIPL